MPIPMTITSMPEEIRHEIFYKVSEEDVGNLRSTCKIFANDFEHKLKRNSSNPEISFLEIFLENKILEKLHSIYPFELNLSKQEDKFVFLFKNLNLKQKKLILKILNEYKKIPRTENLQYTLEGYSEQFVQPYFPNPLSDNKDFLQTSIALLLKENLSLNIYPSRKGDEYYWPSELEQKLKQLNPIELIVSHMVYKILNLPPYNIPYDNKYLFLAMYATEGKEIFTLQNAAKHIGFHPKPSPWLLASKAYLLLKAQELLKNKFNVSEVNSKSIELLKLFAYCNGERFYKIFPMLYKIFELDLSPLFYHKAKIHQLINSEHAHEWLEEYSKEGLMALINEGNLILILCNISKNHYNTLLNDKGSRNKLKRIIAKETNVDSIKLFSKFLNHYFDRNGVSNTLNLGNIAAFLAAISSNKFSPAYLKLIFEIELGLLNLIPSDLITTSRIYVAIKENYHIKDFDYYNLIYFQLWPILNKSKFRGKNKNEYFGKRTLDYLNKHKPILNQWNYKDFKKLKINTLSNIPSKLLELLTPSEFMNLYSMLDTAYKTIPLSMDDSLILNFLKNPNNNFFTLSFAKRPIFSLDGAGNIKQFNYLRQLARISVNGNSLLIYLNENPLLFNFIVTHNLIRFEQNGSTTANPKLLAVLKSDIFKFISFYPTTLNVWMNHLFSGNFEEKIKVLENVVKVINNSKNVKFLTLVPPSLLCELLNNESNGEFNELHVLANLNTRDAFITALKKIDESLADKIQVMSFPPENSATFFASHKRKQNEQNSSRKFPKLDDNDSQNNNSF